MIFLPDSLYCLASVNTTPEPLSEKTNRSIVSANILQNPTLGTQSFLILPSLGILAHTHSIAPSSSPNSYLLSFTLNKNEQLNSFHSQNKLKATY